MPCSFLMDFESDDTRKRASASFTALKLTLRNSNSLTGDTCMPDLLFDILTEVNHKYEYK